MNNKRTKNQYSSMKVLIKFFKLALTKRPSFVIYNIINSLIVTCKLLLNIYLPKLLVAELLKESNAEVKTLITIVVLIVLNNFIFAILEKIFERILNVNKIKLTNDFKQTILEKTITMKYQFLEDPYYLDLKERGTFGVSNQDSVNAIITNISDLIKNIFIIISLVWVLSTIGINLIIFLAITILIMILIQAKTNKIFVNFAQRLVPINRKFGLFADYAFSEYFAADIRLFNIDPLLVESLKNYNYQIYLEIRSFGMKMCLISTINTCISVLQQGFTYLYVALRTFTTKFGPKIGIDSLTMYVATTINFASAATSIGKSFADLKMSISYLTPLFELLDVEDEIDNKNNNLVCGQINKVEFRNVTFKYPKTDNIILKNISFTVNKGEKISIVGLNGAGKSTIVKLICRLFIPTSGSILINDIDINEYSYRSLNDQLSAVFQDFKIFSMPLNENITTKSCEEDNNKLDKVIENVGLTQVINGYKNKLNTIYGKAYDTDGAEFSGGQLQKIAIARSLYKNASLVMLDEPTSALDPISEAEIYSHFNNLVENKTAIYISHRMSSSVFCDKVLVINNGVVESFDTHENLLKDTTSTYYKLFTTQSKNYQL